MADDFATWACAVSQATNSSLAGSRVFVSPDACPASDRACLLLQLGEWGLVATDSSDTVDLTFPVMPATDDLTGAAAWDRADRGMPVTRALADELAAAGTLAGIRIACSLIVEPKTAVLLDRLASGGAEVGVYCHAHECDQRIADELSARGFTVEASASWTASDEHAGALRLLDRLRPHVIIDDGANLGRLAAVERPRLSAKLLGVAEETTSGVRAFECMERSGELPFAVVAVNDSALKTCFDNRHGTGETCVTTVQRLLGTGCFDGASVCVVGFGPVGEGFARRVRTLGAVVCVAETDPVAALRALYAGFEVRSLDEAAPLADVVVSATGVRHTVTLRHLRRMTGDSTLVVIGGTTNEVAIDDVIASGGGLVPSVDRDIFELRVPGGPSLRLLAAGDGINYASGPGNPIEVMDLSFAVQLAAVAHLLTRQDELCPKVVRLPSEVDRRIAELALAAHGVDASMSSAPSDSDWHATRFEQLSWRTSARFDQKGGLS